MSKLIIRHGERVTEHVVDDHALVVGRDPQCDLFFADKKLSRRHARFELGEDGIRLVDLGSRNGCWVNEERIDDAVLTSSDTIRLGGLTISIETERESESRDDQDSTMFLAGESSEDDSRTMVLSSQDLPDAEPPADTGTVVLPAQQAKAVDTDSTAFLGSAPGASVGDEDPTLRQPDTVTREESSERTMMLEGESPSKAADTGTVIFRRGTAEPMDDATRVASAPAPPERPEPTETRILGAPSASDASIASESQSWAPSPPARVTPGSTLRFAVLVAAVAALAFIVLAVPLMRTLGSSLRAESLLRGRVLVDLLAVTNEEALRDNRPEALAIDRVTGEPGVLGAYILDPMGRVLASSETVGSSETPLGGLGVDIGASDIRAFRQAQSSDDSMVYAVPIRAQGRRLGVAVLHYRTGAAVSSWTAVMLVLGSLLLLMGVAAAVVMARRWTLLPVQELRDDVEALRRGFVDSLAEDRPYSDLATIARNFNELVNARGGAAGAEGAVADGSETFKPVVDPTFVPEDREQAER